jgi:steroid delta-isomerase-like uncharacterized protein
MGTTENKQIVRRFIQVWGKGPVSIVDELADPNIVVSYPLMPAPARGPEEFKGVLQLVHAAFPDLEVQVHDEIAEGDRVAVRWTLRGTQRGELLGIPSMNKHVAWDGITLFRLANSKVIEERGEEDALGFMQQLGVIPAPGQGGT